MAVEKNLPLEPLWQKVLAKTDGILPKDAVNQWISRIMPVALENGELVLAVRDTFTKQYIEPRYLALLGDAVHRGLTREPGPGPARRPGVLERARRPVCRQQHDC